MDDYMVTFNDKQKKMIEEHRRKVYELELQLAVDLGISGQEDYLREVLHQSDQFIETFLPPKKTKPNGFNLFMSETKKDSKKRKVVAGSFML
jgi:hypothetical protein